MANRSLQEKLSLLGSLPISARRRFHLLLQELMTARSYTQITKRQPWAYAVNISRFDELGLQECDLRLILDLGIVEAAEEVTSDLACRRFRDVDPALPLTRKCCFIISDECADWIDRGDLSTLDFTFVKQNVDISSNGKSTKEIMPAWDIDRRELKVNEVVVKKYKWTAVNQEAILSAFQEEGWPVRIYDPLPPSQEIDCKRRLHDTIKCLNQRHVVRVIRFHGDGTGEGVAWEQIDPDLLHTDSASLH